MECTCESVVGDIFRASMSLMPSQVFRFFFVFCFWCLLFNCHAGLVVSVHVSGRSQKLLRLCMINYKLYVLSQYAFNLIERM